MTDRQRSGGSPGKSARRKKAGAGRNASPKGARSKLAAEERARREAAWKEKEARDRACEAEASEAWRAAKDARDRITRLEAIAKRFPEQMHVLGDIAGSFIDLGDTASAVRTYQRIIDGRTGFSTKWSNILGKAYLFTGNVKAAKKCLSDPHTFSDEMGLFLALAYLVEGDEGGFREKFDVWLGESLRRVTDGFLHEPEIKALLGEERAKAVEAAWDEHRERFERMTPYERYLKRRSEWGGEKGRGLGERRFYELAQEYLHLDRGTMFGELSDQEWERYEELKEKLHAELTIG